MNSHFCSRSYSRLCAHLSKACLWTALALLLAVILCVQWQVIGRYVLNDTPTWAESLALLLVLYVTAFGAAVGVRDGTHVGFETLVEMLPSHWRKSVEILAHALVAVFGAFMAASGWTWAWAKRHEIKPMLGVPDAVDYVPLVITGVLIVLFSIEHMLARARGGKVEPAWH